MQKIKKRYIQKQQEENEAKRNKSIEEMTKIELEALGRTQGIELDRRQKKETLVGIVKNLFE